MHRQHVVPGTELGGNLLGEPSGEPSLAVDPGQLRALADRVAHELAPLEVEIGALGIRLRADRDVLPGGHRGGAGHKPRDARRHDRGAARIGSGNTDDDRRHRDDAVVRAEHGGAQPPGAMAEVALPATWRAHHGSADLAGCATAAADGALHVALELERRVLAGEMDRPLRDALVPGEAGGVARPPVAASPRIAVCSLEMNSPPCSLTWSSARNPRSVHTRPP